MYTTAALPVSEINQIKCTARPIYVYQNDLHTCRSLPG